MSDAQIHAAAAAIKLGRPVVLPTDTVYGLCTSPYRPEPVERLYRLKGRGAEQPTAIIASDVEFLFECVPELRGRAGTIVRALLPGPYTLILPNPARRYRWLTGTSPETIGVRVPELPAPAERILSIVGCVAATSANEPGGPDPARLEDVPEALRSGAAAVVDGGALPGTASTVLDFTEREPRVLREGAAPSAEALERVVSALA